MLSQLKNPPLIFALGAIRIGPILKIETFVADIQEKLRMRGYPFLNAEIISNVNLGPELSSSPSRRWVLSDQVRHSAITVTDSLIAFQTTHYESYAEFSEEFLSIFQAIQSILKTTAIEGIGLRYVNVIHKLVSEWTDLLHTPLLDFTPGDIHVEQVESRKIWRCHSSIGELNIRAFYHLSGPYMPPDLSPDDLIFRDIYEQQGPAYVLDIDHGMRVTSELSIADVRHNLRALHENIDLAFVAATTDLARAKWNS